MLAAAILFRDQPKEICDHQNEKLICSVLSTHLRQVGLVSAEHYRTLCKYAVVGGCVWRNFDENLIRRMLNAARWCRSVGWEKNIFFGTFLKSRWRSDERPANFSIYLACFCLYFFITYDSSKLHIYIVLRERICRKLNNVTNDTVDREILITHTDSFQQTNETEKSPIECNQTECRNELHKVHGCWRLAAGFPRSLSPPSFFCSIACWQRCHEKVILEISAPQRLIQQFFSILISRTTQWSCMDSQ